jgi:hypothetical protein
MHPQIRVCSLLVAILIANAARAETKPADETPGKTAFKIDPLTALQSSILATDATRISGTELDLLQHARRGKMEQWSMARAALVISGVMDEGEQQHYLDKLAEITKECQKVTADTNTPLGKAKALGKYLHENPMHAGYQSHQYSLRVLLDTGRYNCVSSAVLYNMMAKHCGLEVRAVTMSGHVFSRALDFDIEPTVGRVYSNADRNDRIQKLMAAQGEQKSGAYASQLYRETGSLGLLSTMYQDIAGDFNRDQRYQEAVASDLKAACFDPKDPSMVAHLRGMLRRWSKYYKENDHDAKAAAVDKFARELLRDPSAANKTIPL